MPHRTLCGVLLSSAVVIVAVSALTLLGCSGDGDNPGNPVDVNQTIPLNATTAANGTTKIVEGYTFTVPGAALAPALQNANVALSFLSINGATGTFALTAPNLPSPGARGTETFASCTFAVTSTTNAAVLPVGTVITIANCTITVSATGVLAGGTPGTPGTITLSLNGFVSQPVPTTVAIQDNGVLVVFNGNGVAIVTTIIITGALGASPS